MLRHLPRTAAIATLALAALFGTAYATRTVRIASRISIHSRELAFSGRVGSIRAPCVAGRHVTLYRWLSNGSHQALGSTTSGRAGRWHLTVPGSAGITLSRFYATVARRSEGTAGTIYVCRGARSRTIGLHR